MITFSIVVAIFNAEVFLEDFLKSLQKIDYDKFEVIIVDGGSTDRSNSILDEFDSLINYRISEPDKGIYDAWNKGVVKATGEWILFIGADDILLPNALKNYQFFIQQLDPQKDTLYISSKNKMVDKFGNFVRIKGWAWEWPYFLKEMTVAHPGSLHARELFKRYGLFDKSYRSSGDYELLLRPKDKLNYAFMNMVTVEMREGGISDRWTGVMEHRIAAIKTGGYSSCLAYKNAGWVFLKHKIKKFLRYVGINLYLKKEY